MVWIYCAASLTLVTYLSASFVRRVPEYGYAVLVAFYTIYLGVSQIVAVRIVRFDLGFYSLFAPAAVFLYPFVAQALDMINEVYGIRRARMAILIAFLTQILLVLFLIITAALPPAPFFLQEEAWQKIFHQGIRITAASWASFLICQNLDAHIFSWLKRRYERKVLLRSVSSDLLNLTVDSFLFVLFAFWGVAPVGPLILGQVISKNVIGLLDTPWFLWYRKMVKPSFHEGRLDEPALK